MSTSKKRVRSLRRRQPITLDMIDQANADIAPGKRMLIKKEELRDIALMKKEVIITARITHELKETIQLLADGDERTLAWMVRKLIFEALEARSLLKRAAVHGETGEHHSRRSKDMIKEETAAYGRDIEGEADWITQERTFLKQLLTSRGQSVTGGI